MKKNYLKLVLVSVFILLAGSNIYTSMQETDLSDVMLANIEALAEYEGIIGGDCTVYLGATTGTMQRCGNAMLVMSFVHTYGCDSGGISCSPRTEITYYNCDREMTGMQTIPSYGRCY